MRHSRRPRDAQRFAWGDNELLTISEICKRYPAYSDSVVRRAIAEHGATSLADLQRVDAIRQANIRNRKPPAASHISIEPARTPIFGRRSRS